MAQPDDSAVVLVLGGTVALERGTVRAIEARNWRLVVASAGAVEAVLRERPALVLYALPAATAPDPAGDLASLRAAGGLARSVPVALFGCDDAAARRRCGTGFDAFIDSAWTPERQADAVDRWKPEGIAVALARLEAVFGAADIRSLLGRFRVLLVDALARLDRDDAADRAHRLAGMAGTLGFAAVGRAWLALSEGHAPDRDALNRHIRVAITAIDVREPDKSDARRRDVAGHVGKFWSG